MHYLTEVTYVGGYKLKVRFEDDSVLILDLAAHLNGPIPYRFPVLDW